MTKLQANRFKSSPNKKEIIDFFKKIYDDNQFQLMNIEESSAIYTETYLINEIYCKMNIRYFSDDTISSLLLYQFNSYRTFNKLKITFMFENDGHFNFLLKVKDEVIEFSSTKKEDFLNTIEKIILELSDKKSIRNIQLNKLLN